MSSLKRITFEPPSKETTGHIPISPYLGTCAVLNRLLREGRLKMRVFIPIFSGPEVVRIEPTVQDYALRLFLRNEVNGSIVETLTNSEETFGFRFVMGSLTDEKRG